MKQIHIVIITLILFFSIFSLYLLGYRFNHSTSYPFGIYQLTGQQAHYKKGELILFCPPNSPILHTALERHYLNAGTCDGGFEPVIKKSSALLAIRFHLSKPSTLITRPSLTLDDYKQTVKADHCHNFLISLFHHTTYLFCQTTNQLSVLIAATTVK